MDDKTVGIIVIVGVILMALIGGAKQAQNNGSVGNAATINFPQISGGNNTGQTGNGNQSSGTKTDDKYSIYHGKISLSFVNRSTDTKYEYLVMRTGDIGSSTIPITGWTLVSSSTGNRVEIPQGVYLYFTNSLNARQNIIVGKNTTIYLITGSSPIGENFLINKCSGYFSQFQNFIPYIPSNCPAPRNENLSSIPNRVENDDCFDYINSFPSCRTQTEALPQNWSYECKNFILNKLTYSSCVNEHKSDTDFYQNDWRIYLSRSSTVWKNRREDIVLYDNNGKIVDELTY